MTGPRREERSLVQLLRIGKARLDEMQTRLADLETARASAATSLDWLAQTVRAEEAASRPDANGVADFRRYLEGATEKRRALEATRDRLAAEIVSIRDAVGEALTEIKKLEHLLDASRRAEARRAEKADAARLDEGAAQRRRG